MKRYRIRILVPAIVVLGAALYYYYGGSSPPIGQPGLVRLDVSSFAELRHVFNADVDRVRLIAMLSPT